MTGGRSGGGRTATSAAAPGPIVLDFSLVAPGGSTTHATGFLRALAALDPPPPGLLVALPADGALLAEEQDRLGRAGVRTVRIGSTARAGSWSSRLAGQLALPRLVRAERPSLVFVPREVGPVLLTAPTVLLTANVLRWRTASPSGSAPRPLKARVVASLKDRVAARSVGRAAAVVSPSRVVADLLPPVRAGRVIPFGVDLERAPERDRPIGARRPLRVVSLGTVARHKRVDVVVDLVSELADTHGIDAELDIWGGGDQAAELDRVEAHVAARLGGRGRLRGPIEPSARHAMLAEADLVVLGSGTESFGFVMVEAMRSGALVVAPDAPIARELCGDDAVLYPEGDPVEGARLVAACLADPGAADGRVARARERADRFTWERCVRETLELLEDTAAVARDRSGPRRDAPGSAASGPRVALFQPLLAHYRVDLFNEFDRQLGGGLTVFTVAADPTTNLAGADHRLATDRRPARTWKVGPAWFVPAAIREVWSRRWDVVVLSWNLRQVELVPALLLARWRGVPVLLWGHGLGTSRSRPVLAVRRWQARRSAGVVTYSEAGRLDIEALAPGCPVTVLLNTTGRPAPDHDDELRGALGRVAFLGRLLRHKRPDLLIGAVAALRGEGLDLSVDLVGDGPERAALEAQVDRSGLADRVRWHGQVTDWDEVRAIVAGVDLVVLPSHAGLAVVDAFAVARAVVVTDDPSQNPPEAELVVDGETGYRYGPETVEALADCLRRAYAQPATLDAMSARVARLYRERLQLATAAATFGAVVREAVGPARPEPRARVSPPTA